MDRKELPIKTLFHLDQNELPKQWYNVLANLERPLAPALHPGTRKPMPPADLHALFSETCIAQEVSTDRYIDIPEPVLDVYRRWRPTPMLRMHSLRHDFVPPPIHAGWLRYHGMAPIISRLVDDGVIEPVAYDQVDVFASAVQFARAEDIIPAPETAHAVHATMEIAKDRVRTGEANTILIGFSGHGHFDMTAHAAHLDGELQRTARAGEPAGEAVSAD